MNHRGGAEGSFPRVAPRPSKKSTMKSMNRLGAFAPPPPPTELERHLKIAKPHFTALQLGHRARVHRSVGVGKLSRLSLFLFLSFTSSSPPAPTPLPRLGLRERPLPTGDEVLEELPKRFYAVPELGQSVVAVVAAPLQATPLRGLGVFLLLPYPRPLP